MKLSNKQCSDRPQANLFLLLATICVTGCALTLLGGCNSDSNAPIATSSLHKQAPKRAPTPEDPTAKMAHSIVMAKSNTPVELKYDIESLPVVSQPVDIDLAMIPATGADSMSLTFAGTPGLTLSADSVPNVEVVKGGAVSQFKLTAKADKADVYYITATATLYTAGTSSVKTFGIPIIVNSVAATTDAPASQATATTATKAPQNAQKKK